MGLPLLERSPLPILVVLPVLVALMLALFAWPAARLEPRGLPLGVVGSAATVGPPGAFSLHRYANEADARAAIGDHRVYGALVPGSRPPRLLVASAASPVVAQLLERALARPGAAVVDVRPAPAADPRGAAFASSVLPLVLAGIVLGGALALGTRRGARRVFVLVVAAVAAGLAADGIAQGWLDVLAGPWWRNAGVLAFTLLAIAATVLALGESYGLAGLGSGAALMMLVGNPLSAASSAPQLLPRPLGEIGQLLPPGAGASALRSSAYFGGAGATAALLVLAIWTGAALLALAPLRPLGRRSATSAA